MSVKMSPPSPVARSVHRPALSPSSTISKLSPGLPSTSPVRNLPPRLRPAGNSAARTDSSRANSSARIASRSASRSRGTGVCVSLKSSIRSLLVGGLLRDDPRFQFVGLEANELADAVVRDAALLAFLGLRQPVGRQVEHQRRLARVDELLAEHLIQRDVVHVGLQQRSCHAHMRHSKWVASLKLRGSSSPASVAEMTLTARSVMRCASDESKSTSST